MCSLEIKKREQRWAKYLNVSKENKKKKPHVRTKKLTSLETAHTASWQEHKLEWNETADKKSLCGNLWTGNKARKYLANQLKPRYDWKNYSWYTV